MTEAQRALKENADTDIEQIAREFQNSFKADKRLFKSEVAVNYAYCDSLFEAGVLTRLESEKIKNGLQTLSKRAEFDRDYFDKHNFNNLSEFIEEKLVQLVGKIGRKIIIGRSISDLSSTVLRFWLKDKIMKISQNIRDIQKIFVSFAEQNETIVIFLQSQFRQTQPILFSHWCLGYFEIFSRDRERLDEVWRRTNTMPLGSNEGNGTSFEIDREELARKLGFEGISSNSLDAVSDRDFVLEYINASVLITTHILQLIEDLLFYSSENTDFFKFENKFSAELLETIHGKCVRLQGFQTIFNSSIKGLSANSHRDFSDQNKIIFETFEILQKSIKAVNAVFLSIQLNETRSEQFANKLLFNQSEIFEYLIQREVSFEEAENITRKIINFMQNETLTSKIRIEELQEISPVIESDIFEIFDVHKILGQKNQIGGTSPERVSEAIAEAKNKLKFEE